MADTLAWLKDTHPTYAAAQLKRQLVRDVFDSAEAMRNERYLPRFEAESHRDWQVRADMTFPEDAVAQAVAALTGLGLRKEPELGTDVTPELRMDWERFDGDGRHASVVASEWLESALLDGFVGVLSDMPRSETPLTLAQEKAAGLRPYAVTYLASQITDWDVGTVRGARVLTFLKLRSEVTRRATDTTRETVTEYRVFWWRPATAELPERVEWAVYEERRDGNGLASAQETGRGFVRGPDRIPFTVIYGGASTDILQADPPLYGLAQSNIDHTQVKSDRRYSMHKCAIPLLVGIGMPEDSQIVVSSSTATIISSPDGDLKYVEPTGAALEELRNELQDIERRMARQGLAMLDRDTRESTATSARINAARDTSKLSRAVRSLQDGMETALGHFAQFRGLNVELGGSVKISRDFSGIGLAPEVLKMLRDMEVSGQLTLGTLLRVIQQEGALPEDLDIEAEAEAVKRTSEDPMPLAGDLAKAA